MSSSNGSSGSINTHRRELRCGVVVHPASVLRVFKKTPECVLLGAELQQLQIHRGF